MGWLSVVELVELLEAVRAEAPLVVVWTGVAGGLPVSVALGVLAAVPLLVVLPLLLLVGSRFVLPTWGYERCGNPNLGVRSVTVEWHRGAPGACTH